MLLDSQGAKLSGESRNLRRSNCESPYRGSQDAFDHGARTPLVTLNQHSIGHLNGKGLEVSPSVCELDSVSSAWFG